MSKICQTNLLATAGFLYFVIHFVKSQPPVISTSNGDVAGFTVNKVAVFLGIPFAAPPIGQLRFRVKDQPIMRRPAANAKRNNTYVIS